MVSEMPCGGDGFEGAWIGQGWQMMQAGITAIKTDMHMAEQFGCRVCAHSEYNGGKCSPALTAIDGPREPREA